MDLFFYREPEETKQQDEAPPVQDYVIADFNAAGIGDLPAGGQWPAAIDQSWTEAVPQQPIPAVPGVKWTQETGKYHHVNFGSLDMLTKLCGSSDIKFTTAYHLASCCSCNSA